MNRYEKCYVFSIQPLYPLIEEKRFHLKSFGQKQIQGVSERVFNIKVSAEGHWDVNLLFSTKTFLLVGMESKDINAAGRLYDVLTIFDGFRDIGGLSLPTRLLQTNSDDKIRAIEERYDFCPLHDMDDTKIFQKPE